MAKKMIGAAIVFLLTISLAAPGYCDDPIKKLGRGVCNIVSCPLEIIKQSSDVANTDGAMASMTWGVLKGIGMTAVRCVVGVYETATFIFPCPKDYKPIMTDPEFFFEDKNW